MAEHPMTQPQGPRSRASRPVLRRLLGGLALPTVLLLTACVGIPTSSGVGAGALINGQSDTEVEFVVPGPQQGASPRQILNGFLNAMRAPQNGFQVAKLFMTTELASSWKPDASTLVSSSAAISGSDDGSPLTYTITTAAVVNNRGVYTEELAAQQSLPFEFTQEPDGQWRISKANDGIVLPVNSFPLVFSQQTLYFFDPSYSYLIPDVRWFPKRASLARSTVEALLAGPSDWLKLSVVSAFPVSTALEDLPLTVQSGRAVVALSTDALNANPTERDRMRQQLAATLQAPTVEITVGGAELAAPDVSTTEAVVPTVDASVFIGTGTAFGFDGGGGGSLAPIPGLSDQLVEAGASAVSLSNDKRTAAFRAAGGVYSASATGSGPTIVDGRPELTAPSIDPFRFIWSVQAASAASLGVFELDGTAVPFTSGLPADSRVVSMAVSRDGARLLLYLSSPVGPQLMLAGIVRQNTLPVRLGEPLYLPIPPGEPAAAAWVDERSVATLSTAGQVSLFPIGGPSQTLGQLEGATAISGGAGGVTGLRLLKSAEIWRLQGSGWVDTAITASVLGTKQ